MHMLRAVLVILAAVFLAGLARASMLISPVAPFAGQMSRSGFYDYAGLVHFHTGYSGDATGTYRDIARDAEAAGIRFMIATEHENLRAVRDGREGWYGQTLMLSSVESRRPEGYLLGLDLARFPITREDSTERFLSEVGAQRGLSIIAHPRNPRWAWKGPVDPRIDGMEILDLADMFESASAGEKAAALALLPVNRTAAYLELGLHSNDALPMWDRIGQRRRFVGLYAPDFHQSIKISKDNRLRFPPARDVMGLARNHILTRTPFTGSVGADRRTLHDAIRAGRLYVSLDVLGDATGFLFSAEQDGRMAWMGEEIAAGRPTRLVATPPPSTRSMQSVIHILRDGKDIAHQPAGAGPLAITVSTPGVYRVEVRTTVAGFLGGRRAVTWIYSNPIYLRSRTAQPASVSRPSPARTAPPCRTAASRPAACPSTLAA